MLIGNEHAPRRSLSQTSLLAEVEAQAFWHGSPISVAPLELAGRKAGTVHSYERRMFGFGLGVRDGVVLLDHAPERLPVAALTDQVGSAVSADLATFRVAGPAPTDPIAGHGIARRGGATSVTVPRDIQEVLPLGASHAEFLQLLGRSTRRNIRNCRQSAAELGIGFDWSTALLPANVKELKQLCRFNMPTPGSGKRVGSMDRLIGGQYRPFHTRLRSSCGRLISAGGGFMQGELALLLYQYNHSAFRSMNPSLLLRAFLIERLCGDGIRHLAFVGRCSGLLRHACDRVPAAELLIVRNSAWAEFIKWTCRVADPKSRIAQLATHGERLVRGTPAHAPPSSSEETEWPVWPFLRPAALLSKALRAGGRGRIDI